MNGQSRPYGIATYQPSGSSAFTIPPLKQIGNTMARFERKSRHLPPWLGGSVDSRDLIKLVTGMLQCDVRSLVHCICTCTSITHPPSPPPSSPTGKREREKKKKSSSSSFCPFFLLTPLFLRIIGSPPCSPSLFMSDLKSSVSQNRSSPPAPTPLEGRTALVVV